MNQYIVNFLKRIFCCVILFAFNNVYGQVSKSKISPFDFNSKLPQSTYVMFTPDSTALKNNTEIKRYNKLLDSIYDLNANYDFQFRLWQTHLNQRANNVFVLILKNKVWTAKYLGFEKNINKKSWELVERKVDQTKVNQLWTMLVRNKILTLPNQSSLKDKLRAIVPDTVSFSPIFEHLEVLDGVNYSFELRDQKGSRTYSYHCPKAYLKKYKNVEELFYAVNIVMLIQKFLNLPIRVC